MSAGAAASRNPDSLWGAPGARAPWKGHILQIRPQTQQSRSRGHWCPLTGRPALPATNRLCPRKSARPGSEQLSARRCEAWATGHRGTCPRTLLLPRPSPEAQPRRRWQARARLHGSAGPRPPSPASPLTQAHLRASALAPESPLHGPQQPDIPPGEGGLGGQPRPCGLGRPRPLP